MLTKHSSLLRLLNMNNKHEHIIRCAPSSQMKLSPPAGHAGMFSVRFGYQVWLFDLTKQLDRTHILFDVCC